jgi:hypothetical protein
VLAGSAAFTNTLTDSTPTNAPAAYGTVHASGASVTSISYTLNGDDPPSATAITFVTLGDTSGSTAQIGFNGTGTMDVTGCTGTYNGTSHTTYDCTLVDAELVSAITTTDIVVAPGA